MPFFLKNQILCWLYKQGQKHTHRLYHRTIEHQVGRDLKDVLVQHFLAKAQSWPHIPAPCPGESLEVSSVGNPPLPWGDYSIAGCSHCKKLYLPLKMSWTRNSKTYRKWHHPWPLLHSSHNLEIKDCFRPNFSQHFQKKCYFLNLNLVEMPTVQHL